jgi:hypothetical protein
MTTSPPQDRLIVEKKQKHSPGAKLSGALPVSRTLSAARKRPSAAWSAEAVPRSSKCVISMALWRGEPGALTVLLLRDRRHLKSVRGVCSLKGARHRRRSASPPPLVAGAPRWRGWRSSATTYALGAPQARARPFTTTPCTSPNATVRVQGQPKLWPDELLASRDALGARAGLRVGTDGAPKILGAPRFLVKRSAHSLGALGVGRKRRPSWRRQQLLRPGFLRPGRCWCQRCARLWWRWVCPTRPRP